MVIRCCIAVLLMSLVLCATGEEPDLGIGTLMDMSDGQSTLRGQLRPVRYTILSAGISAKLMSVPLERGQRIEKGLQIAAFDCAVQKANMKISRARHEAAANRLLVNERLQELKNISSLDLSLSRSELAITEAEVERTMAILSECIVFAPFSGTVVEKYVQAFQYVEKGQPLIELVDTRMLEIEMVLPSLDHRKYRPGTAFSVLIDETGQRVTGNIDRTVGVVDPVSQTIRVMGKLIDTPLDLLPGMSGVVNFVDQND